MIPWKYITVIHKENTLEVSKAIPHPKYNFAIPPIEYDIAILKLAAPVTTTNFFVCLPSNDLDQFLGVKVTASGWGKTSAKETEASKVSCLHVLCFFICLLFFPSVS
jgi:hypothetical protein